MKQLRGQDDSNGKDILRSRLSDKKDLHFDKEEFIVGDLIPSL